VGLEKVRLVLQYDEPDTRVKFFFSKELFRREAGEEINRIKSDERKALSLVKEVAEYFHVDAVKEGSPPFQNFDDCKIFSKCSRSCMQGS
jgi:hypothetical protein